MTDQNIEAIRCIYEEWGRGNFTPKFDLYSPDLEWGWSDEFPDIHGVHREPESRSDRMLEWLRQWEDFHIQAEEYISAGEVVVVLCRTMGRGKVSGAVVDSQGGHVWTMRTGRAGRLEIFSSRSQALKAAGLSG